MLVKDFRLDEIVYEELKECSASGMHLSRADIKKLIIDHFEANADVYIMHALPRLEHAGKIIANRDSKSGSPHVYCLPASKA